jgi:hypothetical protein
MSIPTPYGLYDDNGAFLSRAAVGSRELRLCLTLIGISAIVFVACVPYVRVPLPKVATSGKWTDYSVRQRYRHWTAAAAC